MLFFACVRTTSCVCPNLMFATESNGTKSPVDDSSSQKKAVEVRDESEVKYNRSAQSSSVQLSSAQQQDMSPQGQDEIG